MRLNWDSWGGEPYRELAYLEPLILSGNASDDDVQRYHDLAAQHRLSHPLPVFTIERSLHPLRLVLRPRWRGYLPLMGFEIGKSTWRWYVFLQLGDKTFWVRKNI